MWAIAVAFMLAAATYAAFGLLIGVLVRGDLEGFFLIIMISMLDTFLENPVDNPLANKPILEFFPSYGPTQFAAAGAFHHQVLAEHGRPVAGLDGRLRLARPDRAAPAHAPACPRGSASPPRTGRITVSGYRRSPTVSLARPSDQNGGCR